MSLKSIKLQNFGTIVNIGRLHGDLTIETESLEAGSHSVSRVANQVDQQGELFIFICCRCFGVKQIVLLNKMK
jgi:hypothetical protein